MCTSVDGDLQCGRRSASIFLTSAPEECSQEETAADGTVRACGGPNMSWSDVLHRKKWRCRPEWVRRLHAAMAAAGARWTRGGDLGPLRRCCDRQGGWRVVRCGGRRLTLESWRKAWPAAPAFFRSGCGDAPHAADGQRTGCGRAGSPGSRRVRPEFVWRRRASDRMGGASAGSGSGRRAAPQPRLEAVSALPARSSSCEGGDGARRRGVVSGRSRAGRLDGAGRTVARVRDSAGGDGERGRCPAL